MGARSATLRQYQKQAHPAINNLQGARIAVVGMRAAGKSSVIRAVCDLCDYETRIVFRDDTVPVTTRVELFALVRALE